MTSLIERQKVLKAELEEIEKQLASPERWGRVPVNEPYYSVLPDQQIQHNTEYGSFTDSLRFDIGNYYHTIEQANRAVERAKTLATLRVLAGGYVPDWNAQTAKHYLYRDYHGNWQVSSFQHREFPNTVYFNTEEDAEHAIKVMGESLNNLIGEL